MGLIRLFKAPKRYEDIAGQDMGATLGWFRKLRLILFFVKHPDELERYDSDVHAWLRGVFGEDFDDDAMRNPRQAIEALRNEIREVQEKIDAERRERQRLQSLLGERQRMLHSFSDKKAAAP
jgi:hypothetical protein